MHNENWDDLRFVLAVAENGSVAAAARVLRVNHATVLRRIAAFEGRHGGAIFDRTVKGYSVPPDRARLIDAAREVELAVLAVERMIEGAQAPLEGIVRVTSVDSLSALVLPEILARIGRDAPGLRLELLSSNAHLDMGRMESDITVRPTAQLPEELTGVQVADLPFAVYGAPGATDTWLAPAGELGRAGPAKWIRDNVPAADISGGADSFLSLREMAAAGMGMAVLPRLVGEGDPRVRRRDGLMPAMSIPLWVATHADLATAPRIAVVRDRLVDALTRAAPKLGGLQE